MGSALCSRLREMSVFSLKRVNYGPVYIGGGGGGGWGNPHVYSIFHPPPPLPYKQALKGERKSGANPKCPFLGGVHERVD